MRIIKANLPPPPPPWWIGETRTPCCGSTLSLEPRDLCADIHEINCATIEFVCLVCHRRVRMLKPGKSDFFNDWTSEVNMTLDELVKRLLDIKAQSEFGGQIEVVVTTIRLDNGKVVIEV
jgi:hypothetical protein